MSADSDSSLRFDAFICHSHRNARAARRLHQRIIRYRPPHGLPIAKRRLQAFLDVRNQLADPSLRDALTRKLEQSEHLIYLASEEAAASDIVAYELGNFLERRGAESVLIALVDGRMPDALPRGARGCLGDPLYADLTCARSSGLRWWLYDRWRFLRETLRLLGPLLGITDYEDLTQRERRRSRNRLTLAATVAIAPIVAIAVLIAMAPGAAWRTWEEPARDVARAVVLEDSDGRELIRVLSEGDVPHPGDGARRYVRDVFELDLKGRITGRLSYYYDDVGSYLSTRDADSQGGTLRDEAVVLQGDRDMMIVHEAWPMLFAGSTKPLPDDGYMTFELEASSPVERRGIDADKLGLVVVQSNAGVEGEQIKLSEPELYRLESRHLLAFVGIENRGNFFEIGTVPALSEDDGRDWEPGELVSVSVGGIRGVAHDGRDLWLAAENTQVGEAGMVGGVFRSADWGLSWSKVELPEIWRRWSSVADVVAHPSEPGVVAIASSPRGSGFGPRPPGVPGVMLSRDGGSTWHPLAISLDVSQNATITLSGMSASGEIVALLDNKLVIWRKLGYWERLLQSLERSPGPARPEG